MSRFWIVANLLLFFLSCALVWAAYDARRPDVAMTHAPEAGAITPAVLSADGMPTDRLADRLDRIDIRLASLETKRESPPPQAVVPEVSSADADRALARLLPGDTVDRRQLAQFQIDIATLPQAERFALSAALARAMNQDRIRIRP